MEDLSTVTHIGRIRVIKEADNDLDTICVCPHCGRQVRYGDMTMYCGEHGCNHCINDLHDSIEYDRQNHYDRYVRKANNNDYEPYKYMDMNEIDDALQEEIDAFQKVRERKKHQIL